jgi:penicillin-binding protein 2
MELSPGGFEDRRSVQVRLLVFRVAVTVCVALLAAGFWMLQVVEHQRFEEAAENNHLRTIPLRAPRGVLFDRNGAVLVENKYSFTIVILRERSPNPKDLNDAIRRVAAATGVDERTIRAAVQRRLKDPKFLPIPVIEHATLEQVAAVMARKLELPEVFVQQVPTRTYPEAGLGAHLFGYVSEVREAQLDEPDFAGLQSGAIVGQAGVEKIYNARLMGEDGSRFVMVNSVGREIQELQKDDPVDGERLQLTVDVDFQRALEDAYRANNYAGAAVLLDPRNGEVLALTSQPEYDPNDFANGIDRAEWNELSNDPLKPLRDRLVQDRYQPGSTFKIIIATAALAEGVITPDTKVTCTGSATFYNRVFQCDKHEAHGTLDLRQAIEKSCDVYFYTVANMLKIDQIHKYAEKLGLVGKTGIDLPNEIESIIPSSEWKLKTTGEKWYPGETISVGIGQGQVTVTPIALATMMATVANGGTVVTPHVVKAVDTGAGWTPLTPPAPRSFFPMPPAVRDPIVDGLWRVVNGDGTGSRARVAGHDVVGKTGTAQVISLEGGKAARAAGKSAAELRDHGWFVFFAPRDNPTIAGVVFAEHVGYGGATVAPIARYALETYFAKKEGRPLPAIRMEADGTMDILTDAAADAYRATKVAAATGRKGTAGPASGGGVR